MDIDNDDLKNKIEMARTGPNPSRYSSALDKVSKKEYPMDESTGLVQSLSPLNYDGEL